VKCAPEGVALRRAEALPGNASGDEDY